MKYIVKQMFILYLILIFLILLFGCESQRREQQLHTEKSNEIHKLSDLSKVKIGMSLNEIKEVIGEPTGYIGSGMVWATYNLPDGWYFKMFFGTDGLCILTIVDPNEREFDLMEGDDE